MQPQRIRHVLLLSSLLACGPRDSRPVQFSTDYSLAPMQMPPDRPMPALSILGRVADAPSRAPSLQAMWAEQKLIRSAELRMQVDRVPAAVQAADSIARQRDALLADVRVTQDEQGRRSAQLGIRVPAPRFAETIEALKRLGQVKTEAVTTQDVTTAYTDLEIRLSVKQETERRLRGLLVSYTGKLSDVLDVERELSRVITEIEQMKGERRYFDQRIAVSSITVTLFEAGALLRPGVGTPFAGAFRKSLEALATSVSWMIYLVTFLVPWVLLTTLLWWTAKWINARRGT